eukprot:5044750-Lingulodinium_polyedra.AAC.1
MLEDTQPPQPADHSAQRTPAIGPAPAEAPQPEPTSRPGPPPHGGGMDEPTPPPALGLSWNAGA